MPAHSQLGPQIAGQRSDVGTSRTLHAHVHVDVLLRSIHPKNIEGGDRDGAFGQFDIFTRSHPVIGALAVDLDGAHCTGPLRNGAHKMPDRRGDCVVVNRRNRPHVRDGHNFTFAIVGGGCCSQANSGLVLLVMATDDA